MLYKAEDFEVEVRLCEDEKLLKQWNHDEPVIEIFNAQRWCCIPVSEATDSRLEFEMREFDKLKDLYCYNLMALIIDIKRYQLCKDEKGKDEILQRIMKMF